MQWNLSASVLEIVRSIEFCLPIFPYNCFSHAAWTICRSKPGRWIYYEVRHTLVDCLGIPQQIR